MMCGRSMGTCSRRRSSTGAGPTSPSAMWVLSIPMHFHAWIDGGLVGGLEAPLPFEWLPGRGRVHHHPHRDLLPRRHRSRRWVEPSGLRGWARGDEGECVIVLCCAALGEGVVNRNLSHIGALL